eukprot:g5756.t1
MATAAFINALKECWVMAAAANGAHASSAGAAPLDNPAGSLASFFSFSSDASLHSPFAFEVASAPLPGRTGVLRLGHALLLLRHVAVGNMRSETFSALHVNVENDENGGGVGGLRAAERRRVFLAFAALESAIAWFQPQHAATMNRCWARPVVSFPDFDGLVADLASGRTAIPARWDECGPRRNRTATAASNAGGAGGAGGAGDGGGGSVGSVGSGGVRRWGNRDWTRRGCLKLFAMYPSTRHGTLEFRAAAGSGDPRFVLSYVRFVLGFVACFRQPWPRDGHGGARPGGGGAGGAGGSGGVFSSFDLGGDMDGPEIRRMYQKANVTAVGAAAAAAAAGELLEAMRRRRCISDDVARYLSSGAGRRQRPLDPWRQQTTADGGPSLYDGEGVWSAKGLC